MTAIIVVLIVNVIILELLHRYMENKWLKPILSLILISSLMLFAYSEGNNKGVERREFHNRMHNRSRPPMALIEPNTNTVYVTNLVVKTITNSIPVEKTVHIIDEDAVKEQATQLASEIRTAEMFILLQQLEDDGFLTLNVEDELLTHGVEAEIGKLNALLAK